jgi:hypothetical protein
MTRIKNLTLVLICSAGLSACNLLQRHPSSGYTDYGAYGGGDSLFQKQQQYQQDQAKREIESERGYSVSPEEQSVIEQRLALKRLEAQLVTSTEKKQYYDYKHYLRSDQERIYFLKLPSMQARERYANNRGLASVRSNYSQKHVALIESKDITLGMNQDAVRESWGDPDIVEVAGNPVYGNERWKYSKYVSSESGYTRQTRYVYFENGIVAGWQSF